MLTRTFALSYGFRQAKNKKGSTKCASFNLDKVVIRTLLAADPPAGILTTASFAQVRDFDGNPNEVTEADALIAYLQMLGTGVDFSTYRADAPENDR